LKINPYFLSAPLLLPSNTSNGTLSSSPSQTYRRITRLLIPTLPTVLFAHFSRDLFSLAKFQNLEKADLSRSGDGLPQFSVCFCSSRPALPPNKASVKGTSFLRIKAFQQLIIFGSSGQAYTKFTASFPERQ